MTCRSAGSRRVRQDGVRIISGAHKGLRLQVPACAEVRPTPERARETIFAMLGDGVRTAVLDLFAGSGALGIEALSRGASAVTLVDRQPEVCACLRHTAARLNSPAVEIVCMDALDYLRSRRAGHFGLVFMDPPYHAGLLEPALGLLREHRLIDGTSLVYAECAHGRSPLAQGYKIVREADFGRVSSYIMRCLH